MKKNRAWSGEDIRKLARAKVLGQTTKDLQESIPEKIILENSETPKNTNSQIQNSDENPEFLWGRFEKSYGDKVVIVVPDSLYDEGEEMKRLCESLGMKCQEIIRVGEPREVSPSTYLGTGKLELIQNRLKENPVQAVVFELSLSAVQVRNLEDCFKIPVLDRQAVILSIFKHHAQTHLAKLQVELAQLKYLQSRLSGLWMGLSRQRGGKGGLKGRGQGETRLELDRRVVKDRISILTRKLKEAGEAFSVQSSRRSSLPRVALVGYTNAGKSTLMQRLTKAPVKTEDKLFCTLDTTIRPLSPPTEPRILVSDTVGFVRDIPTELVHSFKSTLREAIESRLIIHVLDFSHPAWKEQFETTEKVLEEIGALDIPRLFVLNKMDRLSEGAFLRRAQVLRSLKHDYPKVQIAMVSALTGQGIPELRDIIVQSCQAGEAPWSVALQG
ncbi:MAG: GTPase HflX [Proteobacteria bacterium]|nr:GTPase HflX [Pseudomonadota bacterium]